MNQHFLKKDCTALHAFPHIIEYALNKITWLKNNDKERFAATKKFLSIKTHIIQQLTGEYITDHSIASAIGLLNIHAVQWDDEALNHAGISKGQLPELVSIF